MEKEEGPSELMGNEEEDMEALLWEEGRSEAMGVSEAVGWARNCRSWVDDGGQGGTCVSAAWKLCFVGLASPGPAGMSSMC